MDELKFTLKLREVQVEIDDKPYTLRELNGKQREAHNETFQLDMSLEDGKPKISTKEGFKLPSEIDLLTKCLYDENDKLVNKLALQEYPTTVLTKLHEIALNLSGLDKIAKAKAKNELKVKDSPGSN